MAVVRRKRQRGFARGISRVGVGARRQQNLGEFHSSGGGRNRQRSVTVFIGGVNVGSGSDQLTQRINLAAQRRIEESRLAVARGNLRRAPKQGIGERVIRLIG